MGIIISSFPGCGKTYLENTNRGKVKILVADSFAPNGDNIVKEYADFVMEHVGEYDIVFISSEEDILEEFNERNIDYDLFYPSKERRKEFLENYVRKRVKSTDIMKLDRDFDKNIDRFDAIEADNCYKHKMEEQGHFIGNDAAIMQYINNVELNNKKNEQKPSEGVEESPRGEENNETGEA